jgi:hypothetical protein
MYIIDTLIARQYLNHLLWAVRDYPYLDHNMRRLCDFSERGGRTLYDHYMESRSYRRAAEILTVVPKICVSCLIKVAKESDYDITHLCIRAIDEKTIEYTELLVRLQRECRGSGHDHRLLAAMGKRNIY